MPRACLCLFPALLLFTAWPAYAADESIVITATRLPKTGAASATVSTLTSDDLARRQDAFLIDALAALPGVAISQNGPFGGQAALRLRGTLSEQTLVMIDGVVVNDVSSPGGGFNYATLETANLDRVDVLRGPQSTLWGTDAIGGVVFITTKRPDPGFGIGGFVEGGSFATGRGQLSVWGKSGAIDGRLSVGAIGTDGISKADSRDGNTEIDPYHAWNAEARVGLDLGEGVRIEMFGRYSDSTSHYDGFGLATGVADSDDVSSSQESLAGILGRFDLIDGRLQNLVQVSHTGLERADMSGGFPSFDSNGERTAYRYQGTLDVSQGVLAVFGAEYERNHSSGTFLTEASTDTTGVFALVEWQPLETLTISGGIRNDDHSVFGGATTGAIGLAWSPAPWVTLKANWSQGFKAPTIFQLTSFFPPATAPNVDLQPEGADGWDAGATLTLLDGRVLAGATFFNIYTTNLIQFAEGRYFNVAEAESRGVEFELAAELKEDLIFRASYTYTESENALTGARLPRVPHNAAFLELSWQATQALRLGAKLTYNGEEVDAIRPANPDGLVDSWTRVDLLASYALTESVEIYGRIENLADEDYQDVFGYGTPGRAAYGGVRLRFD